MAISPLSSSVPAAALHSVAHINLPLIAFGKAEWKKYIGDIGAEPPLPLNIHQILQSPCPFNPGKKVEETHLLTLIPERVNGRPLTLKHLHELVKNLKQVHRLQEVYWIFYEPVVLKFAETPNPKSSWFLLTKEVIPNNRAKRYEAQLKVLEEFNQRSLVHYEAPSMIEAATSILMEYIRSGNRLYKSDRKASPSMMNTNCKEIVTQAAPMHTTVGAFNEGGIAITLNTLHEMEVVGIAAAHRF